jgi:transcription termination factor Rho
MLNGSYFGVPFTLPNAQVLRYYNYPVPAIMDGYDWPIEPGRKPLEHQKVMANFSVLHRRMFNLSDMGTMKTLSTLWAADWLMQQHPKGTFRALIVAPARAGKTTLLQAIVEGVAINHPNAALMVLLVDERPEEVSEMVMWGYGEVVASSFDMPAKRHVEVAEMTLERARRLVEMGQDVVIVLDSITRLARAYNTVERGTGRTLSGGLDSSAMQKPKAFFGSARMIAPQHGGGSLTIIATALVETGSRMDDVIFEEFKGTGNCEIKLDRGLADRRIYPAFDIAISGTRREEKLYRPDQVEKVHLLRRGLSQLPPQAGMEWLIKRIAGTSNNDSLLDGL